MIRLYLHIGYPKSGTTALQAFMTENVAELAQARVLYPKAGRKDHAHYGINLALDIGRYDRDDEIESKETLAARLREEAQVSGCDRIVVSSELFILADSIEPIRGFFADFDVKIVVYLRRHDHAFESAFNESLKTFENPPWQPTIESFIVYNTAIETIPYDYLQTLRKWACCFGRQAIVVRPYEKQQNVPDIYGDFLRVLEVPDSHTYARPGKTNPSLNPVAIAAIQAVRKSTLKEGVKARIIEQMIELGGHAGAAESYLSPEMRNAVVNKYLLSYRSIAKEFMGRPDGVLFNEPMPSPDDPWAGKPEIESDEILDFILNASARLIP
jgi:hypothetical protein